MSRRRPSRSSTGVEHVAIVTTSYPSEGDDAAGHFVRAEARALSRRGQRVQVIAPGGWTAAAPIVDQGVTVWTAGGGSAFGSPGVLARLRSRPWRLASVAAFAWLARRRLQQLGELDRVIAHWLLPSAWPLLLRHPAQLEVVCHGSDVRLLLAAGPLPCRYLVTALLGRGAHFRFAAQASMDALSHMLEPALADALARRAEVRAPLLELPTVGALERLRWRQELGAPPGTALIAVVGRLVASKRVALALQAAARVKPHPQLVVVGDGPERGRLAALARALALPCHFVGGRSRKDAIAIMAAADTLLHCSAAEGAPSVIREARALGVPVIACAAGDVARWALHDSGIALAAADPDALAARLAEVRQASASP